MKFGLTDQEYNFILTNVVTPLSKLGATVWCFGSRARGDHKKFSDLDLMVENGQQLDNELSTLREFLSNSNFPIKVDLVNLAEFADTYRESYQKDKKPF